MSTTGRAAILARPGEPLVVDEVDVPDPAPDQVLVRVFATGICHSQLHQIHRAANPAGGRPQKVPTLLGHESTGVVVAKGAQVHHVREGDHVMTTWVDRNNAAGVLPPVNDAVNERPQPAVHWRGTPVAASAATWAEYLLASERLVVPLDQAVATDVTSIVGCAVMTGAGSILHTLQVRSGQSVALYGAGASGSVPSPRPPSSTPIRSLRSTWPTRSSPLPTASGPRTRSTPGTWTPWRQCSS